MQSEKQDADEGQQKSPAPKPAPVPNSVEAEERQAKSKGETDKAQDGLLAKLRRRIDLLTILNIVVAFATVAQAWFSYETIKFAKQSASDSAKDVRASQGISQQAAEAAQASAKAAERSATLGERQLRAYESAVKRIEQGRRVGQRAWVSGATVYVTSPPIKENEGGNISFRVEIMNTGNTPAYDTRLSARCGIASGMPPDFEDDPAPSGSVIPPGGRSFTHVGDNHPAEMITYLRNGTFSNFVWGTFSYVDVFGTRHRGTFCKKLQPNLRDVIDYADCNKSN